MRYTAITLVSILILLVVVINFTPVQNFIVNKATKVLAKKLNTVVSIEHIKLNLLSHVLVNGIYIESQQGDTLLYADEIRLRVSDLLMLKSDKPEIKYIGLHDTYANLYRPDSSSKWNYDFIAEAFSSDAPKDTTKKSNSDFNIGLKEVDLSNIRFLMTDAWVGSDMHFAVGKFHINAKEVDLKKKVIEVIKINATQTTIALNDYKGGRPPKPKKKPEVKEEKTSTPFNPQGWSIKLNALELNECLFRSDAGTRKPLVSEFDPSHILVSNINLEATQIEIEGDTLTGELQNLAAIERCGLLIKQFKADVTVSPNESNCENLLLETGNSIIKNHYAMHYDKFPDFNDFINKVALEADFANAKVDIRDIAYFAPTLNNYPYVINISGLINGPVNNIKTRGLQITDGVSSLSGDLSIKGLPDINNTFFNYQNGKLYTNGEGVVRYAPMLRDSSSAVAIDSLTDFDFTGNYVGTIQSFAFTGTINSNLGNIVSDIKMKAPKNKDASTSYEGNLEAENLRLGTLFKTPLLGTTSFKTNINGQSLDPKNIEVKLDALISHFDFNNYKYENISVDGLLAKKKFEGNLLVNDENLILGFYGIFDYSSDTIDINAKANLLSSNLTALNLVPGDTVKAVADFDMDWEGSNIDNFVGFAKLYNIDVTRGGNRLDLDSISAISTNSNNTKHLKVQSNAIYADILGDYKLSKLPASFQYYIAGYLPAYIKRPNKDAPKQDLNFTIKTRQIDKLLSVITDKVEGFNNVDLSGALSTAQQSLKLKGNIPYGKVNNITAKDVTINSTGNYNSISLNLLADNIIIGDSTIRGALDISTKLGNNNLDFTIATTTPDILGTASLKGNAHAQNDTLFLAIDNSEFYLNSTRWEIPKGNLTTISKDYLMVNNFVIRSGLQQVRINTSDQNAQSIGVRIQNLDFAQIGNIAGLSDYEPEGRINGDITITDILKSLYVKSDIKMTNIKLGNDTIGTITVIGTYDNNRRVIALDKETGIKNGRSMLNAYGNLSFDSTNNETIDGHIAFNKVPISWASTFLTGFVSNISGDLNGTVAINGTSSQPNIKGSVDIIRAAMKLDFLGTYYSIPFASVDINNKLIDLGKIKVYDIQNNTALISGGIKHNRLSNMNLDIAMSTPKFEVINLKADESELFYGNFIAGIKNLSITGPTNNIDIRIVRAEPAAKSHLYLPLATSSGLGSYSYIKFKSYGKEQESKKAATSKLNIHIEAVLNDMGEVTMVMDPATGDAINAKGTGNLIIDMPSGNEFKMYGVYKIDEGSYIFTLQQLFLKRQFQLNKGSVIRFNGPIYETGLDVEGIYSTRARLYDLFTSTERESLVAAGTREEDQAKMMRDVNLLLFMGGTLGAPDLNFKIDLPDKSAEGTIAYAKLKRTNQNKNHLLNQVASILLLNTFIPAEGGLGGSATTSGAINNISDMISSTASTQLTNLISKITGDEDLSISLKYKTYSYANSTTSNNSNRNEVSLGLKKNYFDNRLSVELGSAIDWGKPTSSNNGSNFKPVGDFRVQYLIKEGGNLRANIFRTSSYDIFVDRNISRGGLGLTWRKSFNRFGELFRGSKYLEQKKLEEDSKGD